MEGELDVELGPNKVVPMSLETSKQEGNTEAIGTDDIDVDYLVDLLELLLWKIY